jgi:hypothetical protein
MAIANILAVLCYYGIEKNRNTSFLVTFGIVLPLTAWAPFYIMNLLDIRSTVLRMGLVPLPICVQLKCLQGTSCEVQHRRFFISSHPFFQLTLDTRLTWPPCRYATIDVIWVFLCSPNSKAIGWLRPRSNPCWHPYVLTYRTTLSMQFCIRC